MISDEELMTKIEELTRDYKGDITSFYEAVGMVVVGRLVGWKVQRLVSSPSCWKLSTELFGDLKEFLPPEGDYAYKSVGLKIIKSMAKAGAYWEVIKRHVSIPIKERQLID
jgi:hypothetical protein